MVAGFSRPIFCVDHLKIGILWLIFLCSFHLILFTLYPRILALNRSRDYQLQMPIGIRGQGLVISLLHSRFQCRHATCVTTLKTAVYYRLACYWHKHQNEVESLTTSFLRPYFHKTITRKVFLVRRAKSTMDFTDNFSTQTS